MTKIEIKELLTKDEKGFYILKKADGSTMDLCDTTLAGLYEDDIVLTYKGNEFVKYSQLSFAIKLENDRNSKIQNAKSFVNSLIK